MSAIWDTASGHYIFNVSLDNADSNGNIGSNIYQGILTDYISSTTYGSGGGLHPFIAFSGPVSAMGAKLIDKFEIGIPDSAVVGSRDSSTSRLGFPLGRPIML